MKKPKITVGLYLLAGVLGIIAGLRDIFAPGFLNMSGRLQSNTYIIVEFAVAAVFFALAGLHSKGHQSNAMNKKNA